MPINTPIKITLHALGRILVTLTVVAIAAIVIWGLWQHYEVDPWTRDGRVKANVIQIAPDVTGQVVKVHVHDNQPVTAGDVLFEIDRARFELALRQAQASEQAQRVALAQAIKEARRNADLKDLVSQEMREQSIVRVDQTRAALEQAIVNRDTAALNLERSRIVAPVNGLVTNLDLQAGSYVTASRPVMALVDSNSFYVEGYFEETKIHGIRIGAPVTVTLMGQSQSLSGHVDSFAEGIADRDRSISANLLPNINPTFNWVRLAQRIPVRIAIDKVPQSVQLIAGQTATVEVHSRGHEASTQKSRQQGVRP